MTLRSSLARTLSLACLCSWAFACSEPGPIEVRIKTVGYDSAAKAPVVVLEDERRGRTLPIWIGAAEAHAIALELEEVAPPRPMTHDLFKTVLDEAGVRLDKVVIESLEGSTYFARLHLTSLRRNFTVDARPSDAIALAMRFDRPVFVAAGLLERAADGGPVAQIAAVARHAGIALQDVSPELAEVFGVDAEHPGAVVTNVEGAAAQVLQRGDVVLALDGVAVRSASQLAQRLAEKSAQRVELQVRRGAAELVLDFEVPQEP